MAGFEEDIFVVVVAVVEFGLFWVRQDEGLL
jgi:hypothetical protein